MAFVVRYHPDEAQRAAFRRWLNRQETVVKTEILLELAVRLKENGVPAACDRELIGQRYWTSLYPVHRALSHLLLARNIADNVIWCLGESAFDRGEQAAIDAAYEQVCAAFGLEAPGRARRMR